MSAFRHFPALQTDGLPPLAHEQIEVLLQQDGVRIERIVSDEHASPPGFWYDQAEHEWVMVLQGGARLTVERNAGETEQIELAEGDALLLPAHGRHRIESTHSKTVWLALFWKETAPKGE